MERPWLILRRVVRVAPLGAADHADAEEHSAAMDVDAQHAAVGEAEEHVAVVDAAAEAQEGHAGVGEEAEEDAQAQHAAAGEAEEEDDDPQAQLEESVVDVNTDAAASELAHAARGAGAGAEPDFTISVAPPPRVSSLTAGLRSHPDAARPDMYPYIIAAERFCLLAHFSIEPFCGTSFRNDPRRSHLVVVRHFRRRADGQIEACAVRVPDRGPDIPALSNVECVGLVCNDETGDYKIAELDERGTLPTFTRFSSDLGVWQSSILPDPLDENDHLRFWVPHGSVTINSTVLWYDLSWGIISGDLNQQPPDLVFHRLPHGRELRDGGAPDLHCRRCIAVSEDLVRYVEIILSHHEAPTVNMWFRDVENNPRGWRTNYRETFKDIWAHESYQQTGLPQNAPMLVGVSPVDSNVVYFSLDQRLFSVNVPEHTVVDCEEYEQLLSVSVPEDTVVDFEERQPLNRRPGPPDGDEPDTSRYFITWNLDADGEKNVGHYNPDEHSDHADSSDNGTMDEGELVSPRHLSEIEESSSTSNGTMEEGEIEYQSPLT